MKMSHARNMATHQALEADAPLARPAAAAAHGMKTRVNLWEVTPVVEIMVDIVTAPAVPTVGAPPKVQDVTAAEATAITMKIMAQEVRVDMAAQVNMVVQVATKVEEAEAIVVAAEAELMAEDEKDMNQVTEEKGKVIPVTEVQAEIMEAVLPVMVPEVRQIGTMMTTVTMAVPHRAAHSGADKKGI